MPPDTGVAGYASPGAPSRLKKTSPYVNRRSRSDGSRSRCSWSRSSRPRCSAITGVSGEREAGLGDDLEARVLSPWRFANRYRSASRSGRNSAPRAGRRRGRAAISRPGRERLERGEDDGVRSAPERVHVGAVGDEKLRHGNLHVVERGAHERPVAPLMHVGPVLDHPPRHREPCLAGRHARHAAFGDPRERPVLAVAERSTVELRVARHQALDPLEVVGVDGQLELPGESATIRHGP